jgi:hypothetical protein
VAGNRSLIWRAGHATLDKGLNHAVKEISLTLGKVFTRQHEGREFETVKAVLVGASHELAEARGRQTSWQSVMSKSSLLAQVIRTPRGGNRWMQGMGAALDDDFLRLRTGLGGALTRKVCDKS